MATTFFADRGTLLVNGVAVAHVKSLKYTIDEAIQRVDTMTVNKRSAGWKKGNRKVSGSFELEIPDQKAQIDLAFSYGQDISVVAQIGTAGERHSLLGLVQTAQDISSSVGDASKAINFEALDAVNENGPAVNAAIGL